MFRVKFQAHSERFQAQVKWSEPERQLANSIVLLICLFSPAVPSTDWHDGHPAKATQLERAGQSVVHTRLDPAASRTMSEKRASWVRLGLRRTTVTSGSHESSHHDHR